METIRKTEEVMNAMQNMPSLGEELSFRRTIKAIKEPTENLSIEGLYPLKIAKDRE